jgi:hypothetical protein
MTGLSTVYPLLSVYIQNTFYHIGIPCVSIRQADLRSREVAFGHLCGFLHAGQDAPNLIFVKAALGVWGRAHPMDTEALSINLDVAPV